MKATFEWCPGGDGCPGLPWREAKRTFGLTVAMDTPVGIFGNDLNRYVEKYLSDCLTAALYVTDQHGVKRHTPPSAHFTIHEVEQSGETHGWMANYAGHIPPDVLIEAQPQFGGRVNPATGLVDF